MYKRHKIIFLIIFIATALTVYFTKVNEMNAVVLTSISIIFGFNLTAYVALKSNKEYVLKMNEMIDSKTKIKQTMMQTIDNYFKFNFYGCLFIVVLVILSCILFAIENTILNQILIAIVISSFLVEIFDMFLLIKILMNSYKTK